MSEFDEQDQRLPEPIGRGLERLYGGGMRVPGEVDRKILAGAQARMLRWRRWNLALRWGGGAAGIAAVVAIAVRMHGPGERGVAPVAARIEDVNQDGKVDMLDAYLLARQVKGGNGKLDLNGDGVVDERDVELLAAKAVSVGEMR